jgi:dihydropyrimidine dehydrogenase (NAD+) subunit PreT
VSAETQPLPQNLERFPDLHPALDAKSALAEANRCLFCFDAPCTAACPTHIDVPRFIKKIASGNLRGAAFTILDANILGLSCSRVCPVDVLCEGSCVMHRYNQKPIEIALLQRYAVPPAILLPAWLGKLAGNKIAGAPVACVGGGPASLSCAAELARRGVPATVFDNRPLPGGLNTYGVAEYKLRASDSLREVEMIRSLGVDFQRADVGKSISLETLEKQFRFIFLGLGLGAMERLGIPGEDAAGVMDALHFIERYKAAGDLRVGRNVIVIGGGNTAIDAANAAKRLGAETVHIFYRRSEKEMPAFSFEYAHSKIEGVQFDWLSQPVEIVVADGRATAVKCVRTELGAPDPSARRKAEPVPGSEFAVPCDMVIPALGQSRLMTLLQEARGIESHAGLIAVDRPTGRTSNPRYFAGGDCVNGGREVVDAVADGKRAALAMIQEMAQTQEAAHG